MNSAIVSALTNFFPYLLPEVVLGVAACILYLGGTWRSSRQLWGTCALVALVLAGVLVLIPVLGEAGVLSGGDHPWGASVERSGLDVLWGVPTVEAVRDHLAERRNQVDDMAEGPRRDQANQELEAQTRALQATVYASPVQPTRLALLVRLIALVGGVVLVLFSWNEMPADQAADYHGSLLIMIAGLCLTGAANDLVTLFLALELVSIPTYVVLYLPRLDNEAQEAAMKYFLLSVFSSALTLFGFSYLYGLAGTTNLPALADALARARTEGSLPAVAVVALVMVVAGLGFRMTAVPFHFYAPDVYQGTTTGNAALLAFVPKVAGFVALLLVLGFVPSVLGAADPLGRVGAGQELGDQVPFLLWIMAAVTMTLGNVLALLQDNLKRMLAYSSVAHAGYMLIGLAAAPKVTTSVVPLGGVEAVLFYLVAYGAMTIGAFAVIHYLSTEERPVETVEDMAGLGRSRPGVALVMALFLFSLIGIPLTAGFLGKLWLFFDALSVPYTPGSPEALDQKKWFIALAVIAALNAAIGAWYYLRIAAVMYLREPVQPPARVRSWPVLVAIWICALFTLGLGIYPGAPLLMQAVKSAVPHYAESSTLSVRANGH